MMRVATYEEWVQAKLEVLRREVEESQDIAEPEETSALVTCRRCHGDGEIEDTGEITGKTFEVECPDCDGEGEVYADEYLPGGALETSSEQKLTKHDFVKELVTDIYDLCAFTGKCPVQTFSENGFIVSSSIESKALVVEDIKHGSYNRHMLARVH